MRRYTVTVKEGDATGSLDLGSRRRSDRHRGRSGYGRHDAPHLRYVSKNVTKKIGYKGAKRYVQVNVKSTTTATTPIAVDAIQRAASQPAS
jgi:hypothetical protein